MVAMANDVYERAELPIVWRELLASMVSSIHSGSITQQVCRVVQRFPRFY